MRYKFLRFPGGKPKAVTFSYDDGNQNDLHLLEIINKYGIKCTFNFNSILLHENFPDSVVEEEFFAKGHEIAVHGAFHRAEGTLRPIEGIIDVLECRKELEKRFGRIIRGMAYPDSGIRYFINSASYEGVKNYLKELDIAYARTLGEDNNKFLLPEDWYAWMPTAHHDNPDILKFIDEFLSLDLSPDKYVASRAPRLFYIWGHSREFESNNNWDHLENICKKLADNDEIWYATNIEIYEYVSAYHSLVYSADNSMVYNPTVFDIWFDIDGKLYHILPGQTLNIN